MSDLDVTIIIPTYRRPAYLAESIRSALASDYPRDRFEVLVVSDGDPLARAVVCDYDVRYFERRTNGGQSAAVNDGLHAARGRYVVIQHDDDLALPNKLRVLASALDAQPGCAVACALAEHIDEDGLPHPKTEERLLHLRKCGYEGITLESELLHNCVDGAATMYRLAPSLEVGGYDETVPHGEELEFRLRLWRKGWRAVFVDEIVAQYRLHDGNKSKDVETNFASTSETKQTVGQVRGTHRRAIAQDKQQRRARSMAIVKPLHSFEEFGYKVRAGRVIQIPIGQARAWARRRMVEILEEPSGDCAIFEDESHGYPYVSYEQLAQDVRDWEATLPRDIEAVIGVERSGVVPAAMIALRRNIPLATVAEVTARGGLEVDPLRRGGGGYNGGRVLVVDDSVHCGGTIRDVLSRLRAVWGDAPMTTGAVYVRPGHENDVDCYHKSMPIPRVFEWNAVYSARSKHMAFDLDGVICEDWTGDEVADPAAYLEHLTYAAPLYVPCYKVHAIITSRLDCHRALTDAWLADHGVRYEQLFMAPFETPQERRTVGHAAWKASVYGSMPGAGLFLDNNPKWAAEIAQLSGKPVLCTETMELHE